MTFLQAAGLAMVPSLVWGWFFVSRNPESRQLVVVTFLLGTLAVVPLLLFMAGLGIQLQSHEAAPVQRAGQDSVQQALGMLAFLIGVALVLFGVIRLFHLISKRVTQHSLRLGALLLAALLLLAATLSYDQLREHLGPLGAQLADLFHFLVIFSLFMFLLERFSARTVANAMIAALAAVLLLVVVNVDARLATGDEVELSSISTIFSLPFLLRVVAQDTLTLRILNFMQVYLTFAVMAISTLLVIALVHVIYLLHENRWIKILHGASLAFFSLPFLVWATATVSPDSPLAGASRSVPMSVEIAWYANIVLLAVLSVWSVIGFIRQSGAAALGLFNGLYEEPLNFLGVGLFLTVFIAVFHWFGLSVMAFSLIFLAFGEEYSKHLIVRFTDDDSIQSIDDAIEFSIIVGLAFAFAENVLLYFPRLLAEQNLRLLLRIGAFLYRGSTTRPSRQRTHVPHAASGLPVSPRTPLSRGQDVRGARPRGCLPRDLQSRGEPGPDQHHAGPGRRRLRFPLLSARTQVQPREARRDLGDAGPRDLRRQAPEAFALEDLERQHPFVAELAAALESGGIAE
jgi:hypothetical protein